MVFYGDCPTAKWPGHLMAVALAIRSNAPDIERRHSPTPVINIRAGATGFAAVRQEPQTRDTTLQGPTHSVPLGMGPEAKSFRGRHWALLFFGINFGGASLGGATVQHWGREGNDSRWLAPVPENCNSTAPRSSRVARF
jgi:hypothetical protein